MARQGARGVLVVGLPPAAGAPGANFVQFLAPPAQKPPPKHPGVMHPFGTLGIATGARCAPRRDGEGHCSTHPPPHGRHGTPPSRPCRRARRPVQGAQKKWHAGGRCPLLAPGASPPRGIGKEKENKKEGIQYGITFPMSLSFHFISFHFISNALHSRSQKKARRAPPAPPRKAVRPWGAGSGPFGKTRGARDCIFNSRTHSSVLGGVR